MDRPALLAGQALLFTKSREQALWKAMFSRHQRLSEGPLEVLQKPSGVLACRAGKLACEELGGDLRPVFGPVCGELVLLGALAANGRHDLASLLSKLVHLMGLDEVVIQLGEQLLLLRIGPHPKCQLGIAHHKLGVSNSGCQDAQVDSIGCQQLQATSHRLLTRLDEANLEGSTVRKSPTGASLLEKDAHEDIGRGQVQGVLSQISEGKAALC